MSKLKWYWHRLKAMSLDEMALHTRKKWRQFRDSGRLPDWSHCDIGEGGNFPALPPCEAASALMRDSLANEVDQILTGKWLAFGHLELHVDDPPLWQKDYVVGCDVSTRESAFKLDHRNLPAGADSKLIWELSRWHPLVRLAMAAYLLNDFRAAAKCVDSLEDWVEHNPPYRGWNWTSALEVGMRLIQFTWIDALLTYFVNGAAENSRQDFGKRVDGLRRSILPPHVWFAWRHKSFGTSANNHLLGELVGLILAVVRWPSLVRLCAPTERLQAIWEREVLTQFSPDGGNREQALNYQLFSFEFCWQARLALIASGRMIASAVESRLSDAARFFWEVQAQSEVWDYGDSDSAFVSPFYIRSNGLIREWRDWMAQSSRPSGMEFWLGEPPKQSLPLGSGCPLKARELANWWYFPDSGIAILESGYWWLRWDLSPLGYLKTAAHGHLDALHLSIWRKGVAIVIDPGTGAYYADRELRNWLASRAAHNGPTSDGEEWPQRKGPFLWSSHHAKPILSAVGDTRGLGMVPVGNRMPSREVRVEEGGRRIEVYDYIGVKGPLPEMIAFSVHWQFAPGAVIKRVSDRAIIVRRRDAAVRVELSADWDEIVVVEQASRGEKRESLAGLVSGTFRKTEWAPYLKLHARQKSDKPCVFSTTFLASVAP
ncbi:hypothetical protein GC207_01225 [bacterium]|nr:hypothetical protein [bacterium]